MFQRTFRSGILPLWSLEFKNLDPHLDLDTRFIPYDWMIVLFMVTCISFVSGIILRNIRPDKAITCAKVNHFELFTLIVKLRVFLLLIELMYEMINQSVL